MEEEICTIQKVIRRKNPDQLAHFVSRYVLLCWDKKLYTWLRSKRPDIGEYEEWACVPQNRTWFVEKMLKLYFQPYSLYGMSLWIARQAHALTEDEYKELCAREKLEDRNNRLLLKTVCQMAFIDKRRWRPKDYI